MDTVAEIPDMVIKIVCIFVFASFTKSKRLENDKRSGTANSYAT
jgi:hypothetical protein